MLDVDKGDSMTVLGSNNCESSDLDCHARDVIISTTNRDSTMSTQDREVFASNGCDKVIFGDRNGNGTCDIVEDFGFTINGATIRTNVLTVKNADGSLRTITDYLFAPECVAGKDNCFRKVVGLDDEKIAKRHHVNATEIWER
jgi:hypothetical protein